MPGSSPARTIPVAIGALIAALALALLTALPVAADATLTAALTGDAEVPGPGDGAGSGVALVDITTSSGEICVDLTWSISDGTASAAHIHEAPAGAAGPVVLALFTTANDTGAFQGCFTDAILAADIEATPSDYYVNIHSATFPDGAVRGQLGVQAATVASSYINADTDLATFNENVSADSSCETPDQDDTQTVSSAGGTENNVHNDACLFDALGLDVDAQVSFASSGVGVISACPDPDGSGPKTATLSGDALTCTLSGYQESGGAMAGDFEYHARLNSEAAGTQTVVFCADPEGNGCGDATVSDTITITWVDAGMVMIMKHYCNADDSNPDTTVDVRNEEEFMEVEAGGMGDPIVAVALTVLACPVTVLPGDEPVPDTIAHFNEEFDFSVTDATGASFTLADATFNQLHACEADDGRSPLVLGEVDGNADTNVCVDFSFYAIDGLAEGDVSVVETLGPGEHEFGTVRFTPAEVDPDDDSRTLLGFDRGASTVNIDTSLDDDAMVMLHIYNFDTAAAAPAASATPAPTAVAGELPDTAGSSTSTGALAVVFAAIALGAVSLIAAQVTRTRRAR
ncbi:MAG: CHRD domain-containing protein [Chloroflexota bacterium]